MAHLLDFVTSSGHGAMTGRAMHVNRQVTALDLAVIGAVQRRLHDVPVAFVLWDGATLRHTIADPVATVTIHDRPTLWRLAWSPDLTFGDAYTDGRLEVAGDLVALLEAIYKSAPMTSYDTAMSRSGSWLRAARSVARARSNVHHHYDLGNAFYRLWLDDEMLYTCAYFADPTMTLEAAQIAKMDLVCRKLRLRPGERVVEAGCGWGSLALYMARRYGVRVTAYNVSREQVAHARARVAAEHLEGMVELVEDDYRSIRGEFDVFVSIGMLEHVGLRQLATFGDVMNRVLVRPQGRGLVHFIGRNYPAPLHPWIERRIFPGAYAPTLGEMVGDVLGPHDFAVVDVENLRRHYTKTLAEWRRRFEGATAAVARMFDPSFVRLWRLYLAGSEAAFDTGYLQLFQVLFARATTNDGWWTRREVYASPGASCPPALPVHADLPPFLE
ncbi:MAG: cyclopropane-fatty-acyl-phospholipid synthase family protein [Vicinamibacterales bacterium]